MAEKDYVKTRREDVKPIPEKWTPLIKRFMKVATRVNVWVYQKSGGRLMNTFLGGAPICIVTTTGRKSGIKRDIPLIHIPWENKKILVASQGGMEKHPIWFHNIVAHPEIEILAEGEKRRYRAQRASEDEKRALWPRLLGVYPDFDEYQARTDRDIPVLICYPLDANGG